MAGLVESILNGYNYMFDDFAHPITKNWFLVARPFQMIGVLSFYLFFSTRLGPWYMRNKKPYDLRTVIKYYNLFQVVASLYLFYQGSAYVLSKEYSILCQNVDDPKTPRAYNIAVSAWYYFMIKVVDLLDTVFFVLRKSDRQITSLHLHHHTLMPLASWVGITYFPGGQASIMATLNSFVHAVMYTYYYLAAFGDKYKKYLWWKRHVTELQLFQFIVVGLHALNSVFYECGYPTWIKIGMIIYALIFINMFGNFYYACYISRNRSGGKDANNTASRESNKNGLSTEKSNGLRSKKESDDETIKNIYKKGYDTDAKSNNGLKKNLKTQ
ncbi:elongation of very long chain fatty acids protein 7-like [Pararge aegeria]|uniref:Elongation of very long chain fatty acids protein n=1 Tax=Pararge aegeria aegeria TaxID=348720 RepID=A0A8S4R6B4_9NEOP|nr:elongation of very long chain fatty acids protein 7-like [Pararge aegeria]CAH2231205.1 jg21222 [Pararge aegeria aegeria]